MRSEENVGRRRICLHCRARFDLSEGVDARQTKSELKGVRELLSALIAEGRTDEAIEVAMAMLGKLQEHNSELMLRLAQMRRERSGRRSEKIDPAQLSVMLELCGELDEAEAADDSESEDELAATEGAAATPRRRPGASGGRGSCRAM